MDLFGLAVLGTLWSLLQPQFGRISLVLLSFVAHSLPAFAIRNPFRKSSIASMYAHCSVCLSYCLSDLALLYLPVLQDGSGLSNLSPTQIIEFTVSSTNPDSVNWKVVLTTKVWVLGAQVFF